jgi:hypothetical protein
MKYRKSFYAIGAIIIIASALAKILHLPYANLSNTVVTLVMMGMFAIQSWHINSLEKKLQQLEGKNDA